MLFHQVPPFLSMKARAEAGTARSATVVLSRAQKGGAERRTLWLTILPQTEMSLEVGWEEVVGAHILSSLLVVRVVRASNVFLEVTGCSQC